MPPQKRPLQSSLLFALLSLTLSCAGGNPANLKTVEIQGEDVLVVDMHLHTGEWDKIPITQQAFLAGAFPPPLNRFPGPVVNSVLSARGIRDQLNNANIQTGVLIAVYAPNSVGTATNELVRDRVAKYPGRLLGMASLDVTDWANRSTQSLTALENALKNDKLIGIKLAHPHMGIAYDDLAYDGIYRIAARLDVPVYVHAGNSPSPGILKDPKSTDIRFFEPVIKRHPKVRFILGHLGYDFINQQLGQLDDCLRLARQYPNVWLEASALGSAGSDPTGQNLPTVYRRIKAQGLVDKTLYGSDGPQRPGFVKDYLQRTIKAMTAEGYSVSEMKKVLAGNFLRCYQSSLLRVGTGPTSP